MNVIEGRDCLPLSSHDTRSLREIARAAVGPDHLPNSMDRAFAELQARRTINVKPSSPDKHRKNFS
jgi:hypothetical protein